MQESVRALADVFANPALRRLQLAWIGSMLGGWAYTVAVAVYAYDRGGAAAVGLVGLIRGVPAAALSPWTSILGDRFPRRTVMLSSDLLRAALMGSMAATALLGGPAAVVYALAACSAAAGTAFRPAQAALMPSLVRSPEELTASNVASSTVESAGIFAGPALGGLLLAATSPGVTFAAVGGAFLWSALNVVRLPGTTPPRASDPAGVLEEALAGVRAIAANARVRLLVFLFAAQTFVDGALGVLIVVLALHRLEIGASGVGFLNAVQGAGGLVGGVAAAALVGRRRLAGDFGLGILLWGVPLVLVGIWPGEWPALVLLTFVGVGNTIVDVAGMTLLQRGVPDEVLCRVFGVLESLILGSVSLGAVVAPVLYHWLGIRGALILAGAILPAVALAAAPALRAIDREAEAPAHLDRLRAVPFLALLPPPQLELLAGRLALVRVAIGEDVIREGDVGDRFYVIESGEVEIAGRRHGPGGYFGEIALLRDVPRTATVHAVTDAELLALDRDDFIGAVTGHAPSAEAADVVIGARLPALAG
jgi:MFS family permease